MSKQSRRYHNVPIGELYGSCPYGRHQTYMVPVLEMERKWGAQKESMNIIDSCLLNVVCDHISCRHIVLWDDRYNLRSIKMSYRQRSKLFHFGQ